MPLFCDAHLLVVNKPAGMITQPTPQGELDLETLWKGWIKEKYHKPGNVFLVPIHRLDRPVSGIVLFARTSKALSRLQAAQRARLLHKTYLAVVEGSVHPQEGVLENFLVHDAHCARVVGAKTLGAKRALLKYSVLKVVDSYTLLQISLITGRYHQIRVQLAALGHPIVGDQRYGSKVQGTHILLHHGALCAPHPVTREECVWHAPVPAYWPGAFVVPAARIRAVAADHAACLPQLAARSLSDDDSHDSGD